MSFDDFDSLPFEEDEISMEYGGNSNSSGGSYKREETLESTPVRRDINSIRFPHSIRKGEGAKSVILLDNINTDAFTKGEKTALGLLGLTQGGQVAVVHNPTLRRNGKMSYYNWTLCPKDNFPKGMTPLGRLNMTWTILGSSFKEFIDAGNDPNEIINRIFKSEVVDMGFLSNVVSENRVNMAKSVFKYRLGEQLECFLCEEARRMYQETKDMADGTTQKQIAKSFSAKRLKYMTLLITDEEVSYNTQNGRVEYSNPLKLVKFNKFDLEDLSKSNAKLGPKAKNISMRIPGINNYIMVMERGSMNTSSSTGQFKNPEVPVTLVPELLTEELRRYGADEKCVVETIQPEAVFRPTAENIQARLDDDSGYYRMKTLLLTGQNIDAERFANGLKNHIAVPRVADYSRVLTPFSNDLNKRFLQFEESSTTTSSNEDTFDTQDNYDDEDIPF